MSDELELSHRPTRTFMPSDMLGISAHNRCAIKTMDINELTYRINGAIFEVNRILGSGFMLKSKDSSCRIFGIPFLLPGRQRKMS